jgi:predicted amidohydrolase YtcJ
MADITRRNFLKVAGVAGASVALGGMVGCSSGSTGVAAAPSTVADTVVYGKIYTSNAAGEYVEALAIKDGKYIYVGGADGAKAYVKDGTTKVVDYNNKGLVMAGATEGHGHYAMDGALEYLQLTVSGTTEDEIIASVKKFVEANPNNEVYYAFGWDNVAMQEIKSTINMRARLDEICSDKPMMISDNSGHNAFCNSKAFEVAGVTKDTEIKGGVLAKGSDGELLGLVSDMADNYLLKYAIATQTIVPESAYEGLAQTMEKKLHGYGYTYYQDGWMNYFGTQIMDALSSYDKGTGLHIIASGSYKIDSYEDWETELAKAEQCMKKYPSNHLKYNVIKLFADGEAVESGSGWLKNGYGDGTYGTQVWDTDVMNSIVKAANEKGLSMHIHSQGDAATEQVVAAYLNAESVKKEGVYNGICHGRNISDDSKQKMGEHGIYASININWRTLITQDIFEVMTSGVKVGENISGETVELLLETARAGYPVKSLLNHGINVSSSTDVPAASGAPCDVCGIMEVAVNGTRPDVNVWQLDESERVSIEEAMNIMTINGARQLMVDSERGSVEVGKYADFLFIDKDISACDADKIHEGKVASVYFEGKEVYTA